MQPVNFCSCDIATRDHAFMLFFFAFSHAYNGFENASWSMCTVSKRPVTISIKKTIMGHENIFGRYNRYNLHRITFLQ